MKFNLSLWLTHFDDLDKAQLQIINVSFKYIRSPDKIFKSNSESIYLTFIVAAQNKHISESIYFF